MHALVSRCCVAFFGAIVWFACPAVFAQVPANYQLETDWLIDTSGCQATIEFDEKRNEFVLDNGLIRRQISGRLGATTRFDSLMTGESIIRAVESEAELTIDGQKYLLGGASGQPNKAFLTESWLDDLKPLGRDALRVVGFEIGEIQPRMNWKRVRPVSKPTNWPPAGRHLRLDYGPASSSKTQTPFEVSIHFQIYDGIPLISKWISVKNVSSKSVNLDEFTAERLAVVEYESPVEFREGVALESPKVLHVETDMAFGGMGTRNANRHTVHWRLDPEYKSQVNWARQQPCLLEVAPTFGPDQTIESGETFESFRVFELVQDSDDRERRGLAIRKMYRILAPWVTENPLMLHCRSADEAVVRKAIEQAHETGFEMVILSFGSGFNSENDDPEYLKKWRRINDFALSKGIHLGSYSLYSSRRIGGGNDIVAPEGMEVIHGNCPAITSEWGQSYMKKLYHLFDATGFLVFENDGPYPGSVDVTERLPLQKGMKDSRWVHWKIWTDFYKHLRGKGVYMNLPDYYYLSGSNKCGMGYREVNWSLPRAQQLIHTRQNIFDGTWQKTPSMGWMFVPLTQYHGGGAAATIEPLDQHLDHYRMMMLSNLGLGVQACYRGPRLYDTDRTKAMVKGIVDWFKKYRGILESDVIHGRRADGRDLDWMVHVDPLGKHKAMAVIFNPTNRVISKAIKFPLYYSGLSGRVTAREGEGDSSRIELDASQRATMHVEVPANGFAYITFQSPEK